MSKLFDVSNDVMDVADSLFRMADAFRITDNCVAFDNLRNMAVRLQSSVEEMRDIDVENSRELMQNAEASSTNMLRLALALSDRGKHVCGDHCDECTHANKGSDS